MLIDQLRTKILRLRDLVKAKLPWYVQPFHGKYVDAFTVFLLSNLDKVKAAWEDANASGDVQKLADFLVDFAKGNLKVGFPLSLFTDMALEAVRQWLHLNADVLKDKVGDLTSKPLAPAIAR